MQGRRLFIRNEHNLWELEIGNELNFLSGHVESYV